MGSRSSTPGIAEVALWAEVIVLAVPFAAVEEVAGTIAPAKGKTVIDCTNPIMRSEDGLGLSIGHTTSGAELLQSALPDARIVKTLNQVGAEVMANATGFPHAPVQFVAGDQEEAKATAQILLTGLGFEALDAGGLSKARLLEPFALVWINQALVQGHGRDWAFGAMPRRMGQ